MSAAQRFAFLVHFRTDLRHDMGIVWPGLRLLPESFLQWAVPKLPLQSQILTPVHFQGGSNDPAGWIILVPCSARQMMGLGQTGRNVLNRINDAVDLAVKLGANMVGLGALTASVTRGGQRLSERTDIGVTNGNAFTAFMTLEGIKKLLPFCQERDPQIALVGASGSVGSCLAQLVVKQRLVSRVTLVARHQGRLDALCAEAGKLAPDVHIHATNDMSQVRNADLVVLLTSSTETLLRSEHLKPNAIVLDDTQPRNTDPALLQERPDVLIVDGGLVSMPKMQLQKSIGLPTGYAYACLAETMLLGMTGYQQHFSIGNPTLEQVEYVAGLAPQYRHLGFGLGPLHSFGQVLQNQNSVSLVHEVAV